MFIHGFYGINYQMSKLADKYSPKMLKLRQLQGGKAPWPPTRGFAPGPRPPYRLALSARHIWLPKPNSWIRPYLFVPNVLTPDYYLPVFSVYGLPYSLRSPAYNYPPTYSLIHLIRYVYFFGGLHF